MFDFTTPKIVKLPRIHDPRGNLTVAQGGVEVPFDIKRAYWIYDVPAGEERGGHSHHAMSQLLVAVGGSFSVNVCDGYNWRTFMLNRSRGFLSLRGYGARLIIFHRVLFVCRWCRLIMTRPIISVSLKSSSGWLSGVPRCCEPVARYHLFRQDSLVENLLVKFGILRYYGRV